MTVDDFGSTERPATGAAAATGRAAHWLDRVSAPALDFLRSRWHVQDVSAGTVVLRPGGPTAGVCFLLRGTLRVQVAGHSSTPLTIALLGAGEIVGEMGLLDDAPRVVDVTAAERCTLAWIDGEAFLEALERWPSLARGVARLVTQRLRQSHLTLYGLMLLEVDQRVAHRLLVFAASHGERTDDAGAVRIPIRLTQQDLAALAGASRERTNRALVAFKQRGWIAVDRQSRVTLLRPDLLARRVEGPSGAREMDGAWPPGSPGTFRR